MRRKEGRKEEYYLEQGHLHNISFCLLKGASFLLFSISFGGEKIQKAGDINKSSRYPFMLNEEKKRIRENNTNKHYFLN